MKGGYMLRIKMSILLVCASLCLMPNVWANTSADVVAEIEVLEVNESDHVSISMKFTLKNESEDPVRVLKWGTPFEGDFTQDIFYITNNGNPVPYIGKLVKRLPPTEEDFIEIAGKSEASEIVYLEDGYKIYAAGVYTVQYIDSTLRVKTTVLNPNTEPQKMKLVPVQSSEVTFEIVEGTREDAIPSLSKAKIECSDAQFNAVTQGHAAAKNIAAVARQALSNTPADQRAQAQRYLEWFGAYSGPRYAAVTSNFNRVHDALFNRTITAYCPSDCASNIFAYVNPSQPYNINFCGAFFRAPVTGTDSKAGTVIHELTHFTVVAGTDDIVYGQSGARSLARSNPNAAIRNADSHEYFAENTPPLPMPAGGGSGGGGDDSDSSGSGGCFIQTVMH